MGRIMLTIALVAVLAAPAMGRRQFEVGQANVQLGGRIFMNHLWADFLKEGSRYTTATEEGGLVGTVSELELNLRVTYGEFVEIGARIKNRYNTNYWQTYWENNDLEGSQYMKLRGVYLRTVLPEWAHGFMRQVHFGSSDFGDFSPFTVGRIRFTERDNANAVLMYGAPAESYSYTFGILALPSLWAGPGFSTAGRRFQDPYITDDWAYASANQFRLTPTINLGAYGYYLQDKEGLRDSDDPSELENRYENAVGHIDFNHGPTASFTYRMQLAYGAQNYRPIVDLNDRLNGYNTVPQDDVGDVAGIATFNFTNVGGSSLSLSFEYFNIGDDYVAILGARRETDVLITEGFENDDIGWDPGGFTGGELQTPTLNVDNGELQFDETMGGIDLGGTIARTIVGWHGGTVVARWLQSGLDVKGEYTLIDYNTNEQDRNAWDPDVDEYSIYPINGGLGRPDNAYNVNQDRLTQIGVASARYGWDTYKGMEVGGRFKYINDTDDRDLDTDTDDYFYERNISELYYQLNVSDEIRVKVAGTYYDNNIQAEQRDLSYYKIRYSIEGEMNWKGVKLAARFEKIDGEWWDRWNRSEPAGEFGQIEKAEELRLRAFLEYAF